MIRELSEQEITQEFADTTTGSTGISSVQSEEWIERVFQTARPMRRFQNVAREFMQLVNSGDKTLHIPRTTSVIDVSTSTSEGVKRNFTELTNMETVDVTIDASSFRKGGIAISKETQMTTMVDMVSQARVEVAEALVQDLDVAIRDQILTDTPAAHNIDQTTSGELTPDSIAAAMEKIEEDDFEPAWLIVGTGHYKDLRTDSQFVNAAEFGSDRTVVSGEVGEYLGLRVMKTTNVTSKAILVGQNRAGENVGPAVVWKERPNVAVEFDREESENRVYYDQAFETATIQPNALATIQTA